MVNNSDLIEIKNECFNRDLTGFINDIKRNRNLENVKLYKFKNGSYELLIKCNLKVDLPAHRKMMNIGIEEVEPIIIAIENIQKFPYEAPFVISDRVNFPYEKTPHLNLGYPSVLCLYRGNFNDWFIEHKTDYFIDRIKGWYRDAACNRLIRDGDAFEPMRINRNNLRGIIVYKYYYLTDFIENFWLKNKNINDFGFFICKSILNLNEGCNAFEIIELFSRNEYSRMKSKYKVRLDKKECIIGILTWPSKKNICYDYIGGLPQNISELIDLSTKTGTKIEQAIKFHIERNRNNQIIIPIISVINRPTKLIGMESNLELLNFIIGCKRKNTNNIIDFDRENKVYMLCHINIFTSDIAKKISNIDKDINCSIVGIGCGALGSKVLTHLARCGYNNQLIVDNDILLTHNLARHSLYADSLGLNKADALAKKINEIYINDNTVKAKSYSNSIFDILSDKSIVLRDYDLLLDFSASNSVFSFLSDLPNEVLPPKVVRAEIAYDGKLGFMYVEGRDREPKIDEIKIILYMQGIKNKEIAEWLNDYKDKRDNLNEAELEELSIGMSCSTSTMKIADDTISYHAAIFSNVIRNIILNNSNEKGYIFINYFNTELCNSYQTVVEVGKFIVKNFDEWTIKLHEDVYNNIINQFNINNPKEIGGILLGCVNIKRKIIYIVDSYTPEDSNGQVSYFIRGTKGVGDYINNVDKSTGGLLGYVGEWHTHPNMGLEMSDIDKTTLNEIKSNSKNADIPSLIMIFNEIGFKAHII